MKFGKLKSKKGYHLAKELHFCVVVNSDMLSNFEKN